MRLRLAVALLTLFVSAPILSLGEELERAIKPRRMLVPIDSEAHDLDERHKQALLEEFGLSETIPSRLASALRTGRVLTLPDGSLACRFVSTVRMRHLEFNRIAYDPNRTRMEIFIELMMQPRDPNGLLTAARIDADPIYCLPSRRER